MLGILSKHTMRWFLYYTINGTHQALRNDNKGFETKLAINCFEFQEIGFESEWIKNVSTTFESGWIC